MKKNIFVSFCLIIMLLLGCISCKKDDLIKIKVAEVAHSVFYAPQYIAIDQGYFEEEGLKIELINANGADKVTSALLSGDVQIGLQGPEPTIYLYNNNKDNYLVNFAQLTQTDGSFIFGREKIENFDLSMLKGKSILGGRKGGVPEMTLEYILKNNGLVVKQNDENVSVELNEVNVRTDVAFAAMAGSFLAGEGDFTTLFEPTASDLVNSGKAYLLCSVGEYAGKVPYTAYSTTLNYYSNNQDIIKKFIKAIYKGQQYVMNNSDEVVGKSLQKSFPDISLEVLTSVSSRYREIDAWCSTPYFNEDGFNKLMDIMALAGELDTRAPYTKLVNNDLVNEILY